MARQTLRWIVICLYFFCSLISLLSFPSSSFLQFFASSFLLFFLSLSFLSFCPLLQPVVIARAQVRRCARVSARRLSPHRRCGIIGCYCSQVTMRVHIGVVLGPELASIMLSLAFTYAIPLPLQPLRICVIGHGVPTRSNIKTSQLGLFIEILHIC